MLDTMLKDAKIIAMVYNVFTQGSAVIAGGCLRDIDTHREPKDIDILIEWGSDLDYREAEILADRLGYTVTDYSGCYGEHEDGQLRLVYTLKKVGCKSIDLIFLNCPVMDRIHSFPCNASMVWLDGATRKTLPRYEEFLEHSELVFYATATAEYKARLLSYYPQD